MNAYRLLQNFLPKSCILVLIPFLFTLTTPVTAGVTKVDQSSSKMSTTGTAAGDKDYSKESLFTGNAAFQVPLVQMGAVELALQYNSNVRRQVRTDNRLAPSGWIGVGWNLTLGSIIGEIGGTADTSDDRYRYVDANGSTDIIRLTSGEYVLQQYRPWKITRSIVSGLVGGWTIVKEDGTIMRFGNYRQASGTFSVSLDSTYATRCYLGFSGVVENPPASLYSTATLIPYQWDLTEIRSIGGSRTSIMYQQITAPLSVGGSTSSLSYTRESHPWKITNNQGGEIEFVLGNLNADEYDGPSQTYMQNVYESKHLDTLAVKQNGQIVKRIVLRSVTSQDVLSIGAKKRYLASVHVYDRNSARMLISKYDYCGIGGEAAGVNPGAVRRISYRTGGSTEYRYKSQPLMRDTLSVIRTIPSNIPGTPGNAAPSPTGVAGTDFYVVSQSLYRFSRTGGAVDSVRPMEVYRRGITGWYRDGSFPYDSTSFCQVGNDFLVGFFKARWKLVRRSGEGWGIYDIDSAFASSGISYNSSLARLRGPVGFGLSYFVFKYNWTLVSSGDFTYSIGAVHLNEKGLKVQALGSGFHETNFTAIDGSVYVAPIKADCGDNFFVLTSRADGTLTTAPMMASYYKFTNGGWSAFGERQGGTAYPFTSYTGFNFATIVPSHRIGKNFVISTFPSASDVESLYVYQPSAGYLKAIDSVRILGGTQVSAGDFYYAVGVSGSSPSTPWMKTWTGQGWEQTYLSAQFPSDNTSLLSTSIFQSGRKLVFTGKQSTLDTCAHLFAITHNGTSWSASRHHILNGVWNSPRASAFGENAFLLEDRVGLDFLECHLRSISFEGDTLRWAPVVPKLNCNSSFASSWYWQPGRNFVTSFRLWNNSGGWVDTNQVLTLCTDSLGRPSFGRTGFDIVIDRKTVVSGMGDSIVTTFAFENGIFDDQVNGGKYNKVTVTHPGATGRTVSYFYNDLGSVYSEEFFAGKNVPVLDGTSYRVKEYNNSNSLVRETVQFWSAEPVDSARGVYFTALLRDSVVTDGIPRLTTYEYGNTTHRQITRINDTNSDGTQRVTRMKYPHDYATTSPSSSDAMIRAIDSMKNVSHVVNALIEQWVSKKTSTDSSTVLSADLSKFRGFSPGQILPSQALRLRDSAVASFTPSSSSASAFSNDSRYVADATFDCYTPQGNLLQARDANGIAASTMWGYNGSLPVANAVNARTSQNSVGSECSYIGFESGSTTPSLSSDEDYWSFYSYNGYNVMSTDAHTGLYSQRLPGYSSAPSTTDSRFGPTRDFCPPDLAGQNRKYVITCWVKTESGMSAGAARLIAHSKPNSDNNTVYPLVAGAYQSTSTGDTYGGWVCLEDTINLKAIRQLGGIPDNELLRIRVFPINYDASHYMLVDDIRVHPVDAGVRATAYDPVMILPTHESDASGLFTARTYDGFGRLLQVKNAAGSVLQEQAYYFSRDGATDSVFHSNDPNYVKQKAYRTGTDTTTMKTYTDGLGREIQKQVFFGDIDIIAHTKYDSLSRPRYAYKPYQVSLGTGKHKYDSGVASNIGTYYTSLGIALGSAPFAETRYLADPLNRVELQGAPGSTFAIGGGHDIRMDYSGDQTNKWSIIRKHDEQGDTTRVSTDLFGNAVKTEVLMGTSASLVTSSTYDVLGNLTKSTPPLGDAYSTTYKYTTRKELRQKTSPDAGPVRNLYDRNGNLRFTKDAAHTGSGPNSVNLSASVNPGATVTGSFTLNNRGKVTLSLNSPGLPVMGGNVTMRVKTTGGTVMSTLVTTGAPQSSWLILPQGSYSWSVQSTGVMPPPIPYAIQCLTQYPFAYNKYDAQGRLIESGEHVSSDTLSFTQQLADSVIFPPSSSVLLATSAGYDTASLDVMASGQRNLKGRLSWSCAYRLGALFLTTFYSYDDMGRIEWVVQKGFGSSSKKIAYIYDLQGNLTSKSYTDAFNTTNNYGWWYEYDAAGRLVRVYSGSDYANRVKEAEYTYVATGRASQLALGAAPAQTVAYTYNERDWLKNITASQFWAKLGYNNIEEIGSTLSAPAQYAGNISWMAYSESGNAFSWGPPTTTTIVGYGFWYDKASRLTSARFGYKYNSTWAAHNSYGMPMIGYDKNGNIDTLVRYGTNATLMDNLKYRYIAGTNRLEYISDGVAAGAFSTDIDNQASGAYRYDNNGSMQADSSRNIALVVNDLNNLPLVEYKRDGTVIQYSYDGSGNRVQKTVGAAYTWYVGGPDPKTEVIYSGSTSDPVYNIWSGENIGQSKRSGTTLTRYYYLKDHLGDVRVTVTAAGGVDSYADYYPYGQYMDGRNSQGSSDGRYKYTSKERDTETGCDYFGARYYDARVGRWLSVDPLAGKALSISSFAYCSDNPLLFVDPNGAEVTTIDGQKIITMDEMVITAESTPKRDVTPMFINDLRREAGLMRKVRYRTMGMMPGLIGNLGPLGVLLPTAAKYYFFYTRAKNDGPMDLKNSQKYMQEGTEASIAGRAYGPEPLGNIFYGACARELGIPEVIALLGAGVYAVVVQQNADFTNQAGFFDKKEDTQNIKLGYEQVKPLNQNAKRR